MAKNTFKLPNLNLKGSTVIPGTKSKVNNMVLAGGILVAAIGGAFFLFKDGLPLGTGGHTTNNQPVSDIHFLVIPEKVRPNDFITVAGVFLDKNGEATTIPEGFWRITEDDGSGRGSTNIKSNGSLGQNISSFVRQIPTTDMQREKVFSIEVSSEASFV